MIIAPRFNGGVACGEGHESRQGRKKFDELGCKLTEVRFDSQEGGDALVTTGYVYTPAGDLGTLTDGNTHTTTWKYDPYGHFDASRELECEGHLGSGDLAHGVVEREAQDPDEVVNGVAS